MKEKNDKDKHFFDWAPTWKPSEILHSLLKSLIDHEDKNHEGKITRDQINGLAFATGQVFVLEKTSALKFEGKKSQSSVKEGEGKT